MPGMQPESPSSLVAKLLYNKLGPSVREYTYVDFCAGAGGPTAFIERHLNHELATTVNRVNGVNDVNGEQKQLNGNTKPVKFVLTDLYPHIDDWKEVAAKSPNISFVSKPVDATNAPPNLVEGDKKVFRMFNLAFHHFEDEIASKILKNTFETADGFAIFELQERTLASLLMVCLLGSVMIVILTPFYFPFWKHPGQVFFTNVIPIVPFIVAFDGVISSLRTRTPDEVVALAKRCGADIDDWELRGGREMHSYPIGYLTWSIFTKKS